MEWQSFEGLPGPILIRRDVHRDDRGRFVEAWHEEKYGDHGLRVKFVQANSSHSRGRVLRGLHYQHPHAQGKLVSVTHGEVFDVAVDVRVGSPTFGRWIGVRLSSANGRQLYVPPDFAHGFVVLGESADLLYHCTAFYDPASEHTLLWNDQRVGVDWPVSDPILSPKDSGGLSLTELAERDLLPAWGAETTASDEATAEVSTW